MIFDWSVKSDDRLVTFEKNERERKRERRKKRFTDSLILLFADLVDVNVDTDSEVTVETIDDSDSLVFREPLFQEARRPTFGGYRF